MSCPSVLVALLYLAVSCRLTSSEASPEVRVTGGNIVGGVEKSAQGRPYFAYKSIPFAGFTEGEHRFQPAPPVTPWEGTLPCMEVGPFCAQGGYDQVLGEEDCLHLSVYTPKLVDESTTASLPVLVWLPGGAFITAGAGDYDPQLMMDKDVVMVVPQYRLGLLGFYVAYGEMPGNYGMLDQVAALRWVQENIAQFGGDPSRVTLGGDCAGGASALYHMISPLSQGLFHRVVSVSGTPLSPWAKHPSNFRTLLILANYVKCPQVSFLMRDCFSKMDLTELLEAQMHLLEAKDLFVGNSNIAPAAPTPDSSEVDWPAFLTEEPIQSLMEGRFAEVPVLLITSKDVGNYMVDMSVYQYLLDEEEEKGKDFSSDETVRKFLKEIRLPRDDEGAERLVYDTYMPGLNGTHYTDRLQGLGEMMGDAMYNTGTLHTARLLNDKVPTWIMRFDFEDGPHSFDSRHPDPATAPPIKAGAGHCDELNYFLPVLPHKPFQTDEQRRVSDTMLNVFEDFVNGREPAQDWPTTTDEGLECKVINKDGSTGQGRLLSPERVKTSELIFREQQRYTLSVIEKSKKKLREKDEL